MSLFMKLKKGKYQTIYSNENLNADNSKYNLGYTNR